MLLTRLLFFTERDLCYGNPLLVRYFIGIQRLQILGLKLKPRLFWDYCHNPSVPLHKSGGQFNPEEILLAWV